MTATREANEQRLQEHLAAENDHDIDRTLATVHPECVFVDMALGLYWHGREGARQHYSMWWTAFESKIERRERHWSSDELVIGEADFVGRHVGSFVGLEATGRPMRLPFVVFARLRDGLLVAETFIYDLNGLLRQLGWPAFEPERPTPARTP